MKMFFEKYLNVSKRIIPYYIPAFFIAVFAVVFELHSLFFFLLPLTMWCCLVAYRAWNEDL